MVLPPSYTIGSLKLSDISTILNVDELAKNAGLEEEWHPSVIITPKPRPQPQPKCCCLNLYPVTIACAATAATVTFGLAGLLIYRIIQEATASGHETHGKWIKFFSILLVVSIFYAGFAMLLIYGVVRRRHRYMYPMIIMTICLTIASIGSLIVTVINIFESVREETSKREKGQAHSISVTTQVLLRVLLVVSIVAKIFFTVCYIRCCRFLRRIAKSNNADTDSSSVISS